MEQLWHTWVPKHRISTRPRRGPDGAWPYNPRMTTESDKTATARRYEGAYLGIDERDGWEYATRVNATGVVVIVAVTTQGELVLVEQHRFAGR